jgi:hypothetical protein
VTDSWGTIGGGYGNLAGDNEGTLLDASGATVSGGSGNTASGEKATVSGGRDNVASNGFATVSGGVDNTASGSAATVSGGFLNTASGGQATVSGGNRNEAIGNNSVVPGGYGNIAGGLLSFAAGSHAIIDETHRGTFLFADSLGFNVYDFLSNAANEFAARATGGVRFVTGVDDVGSPTAGVRLASGGSSWLTISDRNAKENFRNEDGEQILSAIAKMPIQSWNYKSQDPSIRHIGPVAQDFSAAFKFGEDEKHINNMDIAGVNMLSIQALEKRTRELKEKLAELTQVKQDVAKVMAENVELKERIAQLESILQRLETLAKDIERR